MPRLGRGPRRRRPRPGATPRRRSSRRTHGDGTANLRIASDGANSGSVDLTLVVAMLAPWCRTRNPAAVCRGSGGSPRRVDDGPCCGRVSSSEPGAQQSDGVGVARAAGTRSGPARPRPAARRRARRCGPRSGRPRRGRASRGRSSCRARRAACASSSRICACTVTSRAVVGSSATTRDGLAGDGHGDHHPLAQPAGELVGIGTAAVAGRRGPRRRRAVGRPRRPSRPPRRPGDRPRMVGLSEVIGSWNTAPR